MIKLDGLLRTTWIADGPTITIMVKTKSKAIPIPNIVSFEHRPPKGYRRGTIEIKTGEAASAHMNVGFGIMAAFGGTETIVYMPEHQPDADSLCAYIANYTPGHPAQPLSAADEIAKFKKLLDDGAITEEEFDAKKKQLLGL